MFSLSDCIIAVSEFWMFFYGGLWETEENFIIISILQNRIFYNTKDNTIPFLMSKARHQLIFLAVEFF